MIEPSIPRRGRTPKTPPPALAGRLVEARLKIGATQKELAEQLGCAWRSVQDYEQGKAVPGGQVLASYGELGVDLNWLLTGSDPTAATQDNEIIRVPHFQLNDVDTDFSNSTSRPTALKLRRSWLKHLYSKLSEDSDMPSLASISIEDDAMVPELPIGSMAIFETRPTEPDVSGLYVTPVDDRLAVRLFRTSLDGDTEIVELKRPARPRIIDRSHGDLRWARRVVATFVLQVNLTEIAD